MTREESIKVLNMVEAHGLAEEAKQMAIQALSQEPTEKPKVDELCEICGYRVGDWCVRPKDYICRVLSQPSEHFIDGVHAIGYREGYKDAQKQKCEKCAMNGSGSKYCDNCGQKSGKWDMSCTCSVCGQWRILESEKNSGKYKFCPNCGAKMESEVKNETDN